MVRYRRNRIEGGQFFFTLTLDDRTSTALVDYIHYNPIKHGLVIQARDWPHSSFHRYVKEGALPADWAGNAEAKTLLEFGERR